MRGCHDRHKEHKNDREHGKAACLASDSKVHEKQTAKDAPMQS
jgi:hypothetical protein